MKADEAGLAFQRQVVLQTCLARTGRNREGKAPPREVGAPLCSSSPLRIGPTKAALLASMPSFGSSQAAGERAEPGVAEGPRMWLVLA